MTRHTKDCTHLNRTLSVLTAGACESICLAKKNRIKSPGHEHSPLNCWTEFGATSNRFVRLSKVASNIGCGDRRDQHTARMSRRTERLTSRSLYSFARKSSTFA